MHGIGTTPPRRKWLIYTRPTVVRGRPGHLSQVLQRCWPCVSLPAVRLPSMNDMYEYVTRCRAGVTAAVSKGHQIYSSGQIRAGATMVEYPGIIESMLIRRTLHGRVVTRRVDNMAEGTTGVTESCVACPLQNPCPHRKTGDAPPACPPTTTGPSVPPVESLLDTLLCRQWASNGASLAQWIPLYVG